MDRKKFEEVLNTAAAQRGCTVVEIEFNDDDNVFDVTIDKADGQVDVDDCEYVHRAVLSNFDRNIEDYALTVGSVGVAAEEADEILKTL